MKNHRVKYSRHQSILHWWKFGQKYWFMKYKWKDNLTGDLMAGVTMAIIQIPQGTFKFMFWRCSGSFLIDILGSPNLTSLISLPFLARTALFFVLPGVRFGLL